jgi:Tfp pilus assembly protein PilO
MRRRIPRGTAVALIVGGDLLLLVLGWFMLVAPQRATAKSNARAAAAAEVQVIEAKRPIVSTPTTQPEQPEIKTAYLYKLSKAMPTTTDMPNLLLELNQVVRSAGVELSQLSPSPTDPTGVTGIQLSVSGDFYSLTDLLYRLRSLVTVRDGALDVSGRLFAVKTLSLTPTGVGTSLNASITLNAFTFAAAAAATAPTTLPGVTQTGATTTTTTTGTTPEASADVSTGP